MSGAPQQYGYSNPSDSRPDLLMNMPAPPSNSHRRGGPRHHARGPQRRDTYSRHAPDSVLVELNCFRLKPRIDDLLKKGWIQYSIEIHHARRRKRRDSEGKPIEPFVYDVVPKVARPGAGMELDRGFSPLSWCVLSELQDRLASELKTSFAVSGILLLTGRIVLLV